MSALFLAPHNDDETLFGSFLICEFRPDVIVCLRSHVQEQRYGILAHDREIETTSALEELLGGPGQAPWSQWPFLDSAPDWDELRASLERVASRGDYDLVFAPEPELHGHEHHNAVGNIVREVFGELVVGYLTYTRSGGRSRGGTEIVPEPEWVERKHRALACYRSQIAEPSCAPWFLGDLREYVA